MFDSKLPHVEVRKTASLRGAIDLPSSKSTSTRAILTAALTQGDCIIKNMATGFNTIAMRSNVERLGATFSSHNDETHVRGINIKSIDEKIFFDPGNSGVVLRLLMGVSAMLNEVKFTTEYKHSLAVRSQGEMVRALRKLGVVCEATGTDSRLPISMKSNRQIGKYTEVSCRKSSQFLSGLLYLGGLSETDLEIKVVDSITAPAMVHTTINNLRHAGIDIEYDASFRNFLIKGSSSFRPTNFTVGADPASTAAILSLCSSLPSDVILNGFFEEELGSGAVIQYLTATGAEIRELENHRIQVLGGTEVKAGDFDGSIAPDAVPALAARAVFADGTSTFHNIEHIRYKESDRISDFRQEVAKLGIRTEEKQDQLIIHGNPNGYRGGVSLNSHFDHGLIMAFTTIGLHCKEPVLINDPHHVGQTYPEYFKHIISIGANVEQ